MGKLVETDQKLKFAKSESEALATQPGLEDSVVVFVKEQGAESGKIFVGGVPYGGGSAEESKFAAGSEAGIEVGGLTKGTSVAGKTAKDVLEEILNPEYAPYNVDATATVSCSQGIVQEVGTKTPLKTDYTIGGTSRKVIGKVGQYEASNGTPSFTRTQSLTAITKIINEGTEQEQEVADSDTEDTAYNRTTTKYGTFTVQNSASCTQGTSVVKSNKGTSTNKLGGDSEDRKLLSSDSAVVDATLVKVAGTENDYVVPATNKEASYVITYCYRIYATTKTAGTLTDQGLLDGASSFDKTLKGSGHAFAVPSSYTVTMIEEYNSTLKSWSDQTNGYDTEVSASTYMDAADKTVPYKKYIRTTEDSSDIRVRVTFTKG